MNQIPFLKKGDKVSILSPAKSIESKYVFSMKTWLEEYGFVVLISENCLGKFHYYSGTTEERKKDFQSAIDDSGIKAVFCARGGYGSIQIIDQLDWTKFLINPKWIVGFSDVTVFHQKLQSLNFPSIHGLMALNINEVTSESKNTLISVLKGEKCKIEIPSHVDNKIGSCQGRLLGGNLSIIYSVIGTNDMPNYEGTILYIEDLCEQLYHVDRMFHSLRKSGILDQISGLIIGGMTDIGNVKDGLGIELNEMIKNHIAGDIPIVFDFPAGHINDNRALMLGAYYDLQVTENKVELTTL